MLELRKYKNGFVSVKHILVLKLPPFSPCCIGEEKRAAISKQTCFSQKRVRSYIVLALGERVDHKKYFQVTLYICPHSGLLYQRKKDDETHWPVIFWMIIAFSKHILTLSSLGWYYLVQI